MGSWEGPRLCSAGPPGPQAGRTRGTLWAPPLPRSARTEHVTRGTCRRGGHVTGDGWDSAWGASGWRRHSATRRAWCAVTPPTVTPAPCTRQGRKRGPLASLAVTSRSAESGTWGRGRVRQAGLQTLESRRQRLAAPARSGHRSYRCIELMASLHVIAGSGGQVVVTLIGLISQTGSRAAAPRFRAGPGRVCWGKAVAAV